MPLKDDERIAAGVVLRDMIDETGWTAPKGDGFYWWRLNADDTPDAVLVRGDLFYDFAEQEPTSITVGEFLGPLSPSDTLRQQSLIDALVSCDSVLSYVYHRERLRLTAGTQRQVQEAMVEVQRITRAKGGTDA